MNNKGFAITTILYGILVLFLMLLVSMLGMLATYNDRLEMLIENNNGARDIVNNVYKKVYEYDFVENESYEFVVPITGTYKVEVWGAQGGIASSIKGGYGGYSGGKVELQKGEKLYIYVGGQGAAGKKVSGGYTAAGGYNGGGKGKVTSAYYVSGGGGATHIAFSSGLLSTLSGKIDNILIVAGGGGGAAYNTTTSSAKTTTIGHGGGYIGVTSRGTTTKGVEVIASGGKQDSFGAEGVVFGSFGQGASGTASSYVGGGGGFYGGNSADYSGGGGSGYIGNSRLTNKVMYCYDCRESSEVNKKTIKTENVSTVAKTNYVKEGNGFAKIEFLDKK